MQSSFLRVCGAHHFSPVDGCRRTFAEVVGMGCPVMFHIPRPGMKHQPTESSWVETLPCSSGVLATDNPSLQIKLIGVPEEKGTLSFHPNTGSHVSYQGAYLVCIGECGPILPPPMTHPASAEPMSL